VPCRLGGDRTASMRCRCSGVPMPSRLTFTSAFQGLRSLPVCCGSPSGLRLLPEHARGHGQSLPHQTVVSAGSGSDRAGSLVMPPFGVARALSLDVRFGLPGPSFTARPLRFAIRASLAAGARSRARATPLSSNGRLSRKPRAVRLLEPFSSLTFALSRLSQ